MLQGHWGFNKLEKYNEEYFLESDRELDDLCPFSKPEWCECPHLTKGNPIKDFWNDENAQIYINESYIRFTLPKEIEINFNSFQVYYYSGIETVREIIKNKEMLKTNYVPLIVRNFHVDGKQNRFLELLLPQLQKIGRSVILETRGVKIPVPWFVRRI